MLSTASSADVPEHALSGEYLALEEIDDGLWNIVFYNRCLLATATGRSNITGADLRSDKG